MQRSIIFPACLNEPPHLPNADLIAPGGQLIGDVRIYKCIHGYMYPGSPDGVIETICEAIKGHVGWRKPVHAHGCIGMSLKMFWNDQ